jgi:hypothetical protein
LRVGVGVKKEVGEMKKEERTERVQEELLILKSKKEGFLLKMEKFNRKARKLNTPEMEVEFGEEVLQGFDFDKDGYRTDCENMISRKIRMQKVTVSYQIAKFQGWSLISIFDCEPFEDEEGEMKLAVFTNSVPGMKVPPEFQNKTEIHCDHCGIKRFRKKSYLVSHEEEGYKEVGSTCLREFLGIDPSGFIYAAGYLDMIRSAAAEYEIGFFTSADYVYNLSNLLALTNRMIEMNGWISRGEANGDIMKQATADQILTYLNDLEKDRVKRIEIQKEDEEIAKKVLDYFRSLENQDNDYIMNCLKILKLNAVPYKRFGIACSMVQAYRRNAEKVEKKKSRVPSEWIGTVGERIRNIEVTCIFRTVVESHYGVSVLYKFLDGEGRIYKTFYSGSSWRIEQGEKGKLTGTIKKHDTYKNQKETSFSRVKIEKEEVEEVPEKEVQEEDSNTRKMGKYKSGSWM